MAARRRSPASIRSRPRQRFAWTIPIQSHTCTAKAPVTVWVTESVSCSASERRPIWRAAEYLRHCLAGFSHDKRDFVNGGIKAVILATGYLAAWSAKRAYAPSLPETRFCARKDEVLDA